MDVFEEKEKTSKNADEITSLTTPLHFAAFYGHEQALSALMTHYKNLNAKDDNGCTALDLASYAGHTNCVNLLLASESQTDVLVYSHKSKRTALHAAGIFLFLKKRPVT